MRQVDKDFPDTLVGKMTEHAYRINMSNYYRDLGNLEQAEQEWKAAEEVLASDKLPAGMKDGMCCQNLTQKFCLNMEQGIFNGAEEFFIARFHAEKTSVAGCYANIR